MRPVTNSENAPARRIKKIAVVGFAGYLSDYTVTFFRMPRIGPVMMATLLSDKGYDVKMFAEGVKEFDKKALDYICSADFVGISVLTYGANRAYAMCSLIRQVNPDAKILMGDVHPTVMPDHALRHCDFVIRGEGDEAILELLANLDREPGCLGLDEIAGLSYWEGDTVVHNPKRARPKNIEVIPDLSLVNGFYEEVGWKTRLNGRMTMAVAQASRGCPIACSFCLGASILGTKYRTRGVEGVIENLHEIRKRAKGRKITVYFVDNHFFINKKWTKELLRRIIEEGFNFYFVIFAQYFIGNDEEVLDLIAQAGQFRIFIGFESINPQTLKEFNKRQSEDMMRKCIKKIQAKGIQIHGSFMLGGETDTMETMQATIDFAMETNIVSASFFGLCEYPFENYPFVPATNCLPPKRLLPKRNLDHYNLNFVSIFPKLMRPSQLQQGLIDAHKRFFSIRRSLRSLSQGKVKMAFRRFAGHYAQRIMVRQMEAYMPYLREVEKGLYDAQDRLIEEKLPEADFQFQNPYPGLYNKVYGLPEDQVSAPKVIRETRLAEPHGFLAVEA